jgi:glyoxylase-like metal-dependent hydrolase (beta-lactamase superfamily II)
VKVHAIQTGTVAVRTRQREGSGHGPTRVVRTMTDRRWTAPLPIYAWLIEHQEGLIVVDTGETARANDRGYFPRWHPYFRLAVREWVRPADEIGPQVTALGFSPNDVRWVILTHLHTDHAGGLAHFPHSEMLVFRLELESARGLMGQVRGFLPHRWPEWFSPRVIDLDRRPLGPFPESYRVTEAGDVTIVATHGHTPGHVSVVLDEGDQIVLFAGDASYTEALMVKGAIDGVAADERAAGDTLDRIRRFTRERPVVYLPSHDPDAGARLAARQTVDAPR